MDFKIPCLDFKVSSKAFAAVSLGDNGYREMRWNAGRKQAVRLLGSIQAG
ncbi:hypothetical protein FLA_1991 [Filimonas lacunae]|nr:hypothetical protein FLA_1991 [Filimonas lacunae]